MKRDIAAEMSRPGVPQDKVQKYREYREKNSERARISRLRKRRRQDALEELVKQQEITNMAALSTEIEELLAQLDGLKDSLSAMAIAEIRAIRHELELTSKLVAVCTEGVETEKITELLEQMTDRRQTLMRRCQSLVAMASGDVMDAIDPMAVKLPSNALVSSAQLKEPSAILGASVNSSAFDEIIPTIPTGDPATSPFEDAHVGASPFVPHEVSVGF